MPVLDADKVVAALRGAFAREVAREELLRTAAEKIRAAGAALHLGLPLHAARRRAGARGVRRPGDRSHPHPRRHRGLRDRRGDGQGSERAGRAARWGTTSRATPGPAPSWWCSSAAASAILGQIDVDSDVPDPFTAEEEAEVRRVADALAVLL